MLLPSFFLLSTRSEQCLLMIFIEISDVCRQIFIFVSVFGANVMAVFISRFQNVAHEML